MSRPKQKDLPGMEDRPLKDLEHWAERYVEVRDDRIALTKREVELKEEGLRLMHRHGRKSYRRGSINIEVVPEAETVKVRIEDEDVKVSKKEK